MEGNIMRVVHGEVLLSYLLLLFTYLYCKMMWFELTQFVGDQILLILHVNACHVWAFHGFEVLCHPIF